MAEFDDKLNSLLSDPNAMAQIMQLAQSLSGGSGPASPPPPQPDPACPARRCRPGRPALRAAFSLPPGGAPVILPERS